MAIRELIGAEYAPRVTRATSSLRFGAVLVSLFLLPHVRSVTGADSSPGMLDVLRKKITEGGIENIAHLIKTHFDLGGTQINLNIMDAEKVLEAHKDPSKYPDLIVRVTGFSAYFSSLSLEQRQQIVDRIVAAE